MNEDQYTNEIIIPLLKHMGFIEVRYNHGAQEFGKDVLFAEFDRFGNKKYHAAQIKVGNIAGGNNKRINDLVDHIINAFEIPFDDLVTKKEQNIVDFFVFTNGEFVGNAKEIILKNTRLKPYLHRVYFYNRQLTTELSTNKVKEIKELLTAELNEIRRNIQIAKTIEILLKDESMSVVGLYLINNLPNLINKLLSQTLYQELRLKLEIYQQYLVKCNNVISQMPIIKILKGDSQERKSLLYDTGKIKEISNELISLIEELLKIL